jgi:hypothetical protein
VVSELVLSPPDAAPSGSGPFSTVVSVPAAGAREVSLSLFTLSLAQASVPAAVPEPASLALMLSGVGWLVAVRRNRARRSSRTG